MAKRLSKERKISALYSSDLQSDYETAHIIADECGWIKVQMFDPTCQLIVNNLHHQNHFKATKSTYVGEN